jgi:hypothetical protein
MPACNDGWLIGIRAVGGKAQKLPLHSVELGEICRDEMIAAALAGHHLEGATTDSFILFDNDVAGPPAGPRMDAVPCPGRLRSARYSPVVPA